MENQLIKADVLVREFLRYLPRREYMYCTYDWNMAMENKSK